MREDLAKHISSGEVTGLVALLNRRGETQVEALGAMATGGAPPMARDTLFRIASVTKPVTAVAAMALVDDGKLALDEPLDKWLPELAGSRVLRRLDGPLDDTVPAHRPISVRDLMTLRFGLGFIMAQDAPIQQAFAERGLAPGPDQPGFPDADAYMAAFADLPLAYQPGEAWLYHTGLDVLGVLVARVSGQSLEAHMRRRIFEPLGMKDTGFSVPADKLDRLPPCYTNDENGRALYDAGGASSRFSEPRGFQAGGSGLVSTAGDVAAFGQMMLAGGAGVLSPASVEAMTTDQLTTAQRQASEIFLDGAGWGLGMAVAAADSQAVPGGFGWDGGYGTSWRSDPKAGLVGVLLTQQLWTSPEPPRVLRDFWTAAYRGA
ncbi:MAG: serine hydrolase domain-containing protein [Phenylobacterium sp.]|uniref:serine hydrolase domain-containing protein n=1 Tax=Phenylobacterium sp. TaxID=1871053 RepID=UPI00273315C8|nr:serine hydrolase domain-containing protein [Phenylobacterium sp.]MDP3745569.1 serine hydrolase domain-containing protein [Phenylobacterium sp.]